MTVKLLTEHQMEFLSLKGGCTGWSESTLVKVSHCWKSHVQAQIFYEYYVLITLHKYQGKQFEQSHINKLKNMHQNTHKHFYV